MKLIGTSDRPIYPFYMTGNFTELRFAQVSEDKNSFVVYLQDADDKFTVQDEIPISIIKLALNNIGEL